MATRWARVARGLVASSVAVFVAAFAHVAGGGQVPDAAGVLLAFAFCVLASIGLAGRRVSTWRLAATVILSQGVFHLLFLMSSGTATSAPLGPGMHMTGGPITAVAGPAMVEDGWMWLAHAAAALVTIAALAFGERTFWRLFELVFRALRVWRSVLSPRTRPSAALAVVRVLRVLFLVGATSRRGPPTVSASV